MRSCGGYGAVALAVAVTTTGGRRRRERSTLVPGGLFIRVPLGPPVVVDAHPNGSVPIISRVDLAGFCAKRILQRPTPWV
jgi:hypothetical protein